MRAWPAWAILLTGLLARAASAGADAVCPAESCDGKIEEVSLFIGSQSVRASYRLRTFGAENWYAGLKPASGGKTDLGMKWTDEKHGVRNLVLESLQGHPCRRIKLLAIFSHGGPASVAIGAENKSELTPANLDSEFAGLDCLMAKDATVNFGGCEVGYGCVGRAFMVGAARNLLKGGGQVMSCLDPNSAGLLVGVVWGPACHEQALGVSAGPSALAWNPPRKGENCTAELDGSVERTQWYLDHCDFPRSPGQKINVEQQMIKDDLEELRKIKAGLTGLDLSGDHELKPEVRGALLGLYQGLENYTEHYINPDDDSTVWFHPVKVWQSQAPSGLQKYEAARQAVVEHGKADSPPCHARAVNIPGDGGNAPAGKPAGVAD